MASFASCALTAAAVSALGVPLIAHAAPTPPAAAARPAVTPTPAADAVVDSPAGDVLRAVLGDPAVFGPGWKASPATLPRSTSGGSDLAGAPTTPAALAATAVTVPFSGCRQPLNPAAAPVVSGGRNAVGALGPRTGAQVRVWAVAAGQGQLALDALRTQVSSCASAAVYSIGAGRFSADGGTGSQPISWMMLRRGDLLVSVVVSAFGGSAAQPAAALSDRLEVRMLSALNGRCAELSPTADDAGRNPFTGRPAHPFTTTVDVPIPPVAPIAPTTVQPLPVAAPAPTPSKTATAQPSATPREHPELAPVLPAPSSSWTDSNGDGLPDTPPAITTAARGPAPVFLDPQTLPSPSDLPSPQAPRQPTLTSTSMTAALPADDVTGPGCGWAFTGSARPHPDPAALQTADTAALDAALADASAAAEQVRAGQLAWRGGYAQYLTDQLAYDHEQQVRANLDAALTAQQQAQSTYDASVRAYMTLPGTSQPPPTPTPQPTPSATPGPSPSPSPTFAGGSPVPSPTGPGPSGMPSPLNTPASQP